MDNDSLHREYAERILSACEPTEDPAEALVIADYFLEREETRLAAAALDRARGLCPDDAGLAARCLSVLDGLV